MLIVQISIIFTDHHSHSQRSCLCRLIPFDHTLLTFSSLPWLWKVRLIAIFVYLAFHKIKIQSHCLFLLLKQIAVTKLQTIITFLSFHTFPLPIRTDLISSAHLLSMITPLTNRSCMLILLSAFRYFSPKCLIFSLHFHLQPSGYEALRVSTCTAFGKLRFFLPFTLNNLLWSSVWVSTELSLLFFTHPVFSTSFSSFQNRTVHW